MATTIASVAQSAEPVHLIEMVFPHLTNHYGTMFGGKVLEIMDRAAFVAASRFGRQAFVTVSTERIDFLVPIKHGYLVDVTANVVYTGRTSLTVKVSLFAEHPQAPSSELAAVGYFHMVAVGPDGRPTAVPALALDTPEDVAEADRVAAMHAARQAVPHG
jgi:acyl-CoA hydrolase